MTSPFQRNRHSYHVTSSSKLTGAIVGIAAASYAAYSLDGGFRSMIREGLVKVQTIPHLTKQAKLIYIFLKAFIESL